MPPRAVENNNLCKIWWQTKYIMGHSKIENRVGKFRDLLEENHLRLNRSFSCSFGRKTFFRFFGQ